MRVLLFVLISSVCRVASGQDFAFAVTNCDTKSGTLNLRQVDAAYSATIDDSAFAGLGELAGRNIVRIYDLTEGRTLKDDGSPYLAQKKTHVVQCVLLGVAYRVVISPWIEAPLPYGPCGGYGPNVEVSVWRNGTLLVSKAHFVAACLADNDHFQWPYILNVELREKDRVGQWTAQTGETTSERRHLGYKDLGRAAADDVALLNLQPPNPSLERP